MLDAAADFAPHSARNSRRRADSNRHASAPRRRNSRGGRGGRPGRAGQRVSRSTPILAQGARAARVEVNATSTIAVARRLEARVRRATRADIARAAQPELSPTAATYVLFAPQWSAPVPPDSLTLLQPRRPSVVVCRLGAALVPRREEHPAFAFSPRRRGQGERGPRGRRPARLTRPADGEN